MTWPPRGPLLAASTLLALVIGAGTGIASLAVHEKSWLWLALALAAPAATTVALPAGWLRSGFCLGWVSLVLVALQTRPEGDFVVMSSTRGYTVFGFGMALLIAMIVTIPARRRSKESESATRPT
ncbi:hypothetical protein ncot_14645 [Nocardioides sp. JQ2195]|uniref:hypothetical protein n=1 Tax=Nocardioides sp. JQ2195 TaxID=2592334 RepID=UPI00143EEBE2|nr:hypothetical protein [Nocardioides sp. JQ2195]QIX27695.1 hypothetical protein ncot_14645 [Nocardioides sp. JQ2195]